jgi:hypothetical protein
MSAFFVNWDAILLPESLQERFIYRWQEGEVSEAKWPRGTFRSVVLQAQEEFQKLARAHMVPPASA